MHEKDSEGKEKYESAWKEFTDAIAERDKCEREFKKVKSKLEWLEWKGEKDVKEELKRLKDVEKGKRGTSQTYATEKV